MYYIYDMVFSEVPEEIRRYGIRYTFEKCTRMGDRLFYSFFAPGHERVLVIPGFAEQYYEFVNVCRKFGANKTAEAYERLIRKHITEEYDVDIYPDEESETGTMTVYGVPYKDIYVRVECSRNELRVQNEFEIRKNDIFGNGNVVEMKAGREE